MGSEGAPGGARHGRSGYEPGLDGLRALAVAAVLAFHDHRLRGGFLGVSTFFTLSGFLITRLLLAEWHGANHISLRRFYTRRIRRLLPAALLGLVVAAAVAVVLHDARTSRAFGFDSLGAVANVANWRFLWSGRAYADLFAAPSPLQHYWSLSVEEQFYLVLAPVIAGVLFLSRGRRVVIAALLGGLAALSFLDGWLSVAHGVDRAYYGTDTRALEFLVGSLLAVAMARRTLGRGASRVAATLGPVALIGLAWATTQRRCLRRRPVPWWIARVRARRVRADPGRVPTGSDPDGMFVGSAARARPHQLRRVRVPLAPLPLAHARPHRARRDRAQRRFASRRRWWSPRCRSSSWSNRFAKDGPGFRFADGS